MQGRLLSAVHINIKGLGHQILRLELQEEISKFLDSQNVPSYSLQVFPILPIV